MKSNIGIIIRREFLERVTKKSFIATTLLMPIFMIAVMVAPTLITIFSTPEQVKIAVIDDSGLIAPTLKDDNSITFVQINDNLEIAKANDSIDGILVIGQNIVNTTSDVTFYSHDASSLLIEQNISSQLEKAIENIRRENYNIEGLDEIVESLNVDINLTTYRINETEDSTSSSFLSYAIGMAMSLLLYMFLLLYGQLVMTSIIEEKNNRVLEIMVSSIKPGQLMLGKILGIGSVALTQVAIWGIILVSISAFLLPAILPADIMAEVTAFNTGSLNAATAQNDIETLQAISILSNVGYIVNIIIYLILFLIGGFLFYAALNAAIGSAVDNVQDASQLQSVVMVPIILGLVMSMSVVSDPNSTLATILSMIPFTSPMTMMTRIPFGIPTWEIITSLVILYASFIGMVWIASKIYRVGIFMYGKKPSIKELIKWINYK
ncbi:MAG: ABC transporter permease [Muribaculaceae bacterium]|nr:ABC transporter permease [Muribaculaceae bacterium]